MMNGHHKIYNAFAFKNVTKPVAIPMHALGVGSAELLDPVGVETPYPKHIQDQAKSPDITYASHDKVQIDGYAKPLTAEDFPKDLNMGSPLGGF